MQHSNRPTDTQTNGRDLREPCLDVTDPQCSRWRSALASEQSEAARLTDTYSGVCRSAAVMYPRIGNENGFQVSHSKVYHIQAQRDDQPVRQLAPEPIDAGRESSEWRAWWKRTTAPLR